MHKTLLALALICATSFATLSDITLTATTPVASATQGYTITGANNDNIGTIIADIGDFNNDGQPDYALASASTTAPKVYIILGQASGRSAAVDLTQSLATSFLTVTLPTTAVVTALAGGDINGDGSGDIAIGCAASDRVYVVYGKGATTWATTYADPTITADGTLNGVTGFVIKSTAGSKLLGQSLAIGDFAGTTNNDIVVGVPSWGAGTEGAICIVYGKPNSGTASTASIAATRGITPVDCDTFDTLNAAGILEGILYKGATADQIGQVVAAGSDLDGDGNDDIFVSAKGAAKAYVLYGSANAAPAATTVETDISSGSLALALTLPTPANGVTAARFIGNFNGGTKPALAVGVPGYSNNKGRVYVLLGRTNTRATSPLDLTAAGLVATTAIHYTGKDTSGYFGYSLAGADVNGDGASDLIVGAPLADASARNLASNNGKVFIIYGSATNTASVDLSAAGTTLNGITITGLAQTHFGMGVSSAGGNIGGDTAKDFIVGAPAGVKASGTANGVVYEFRGQNIDAPKTTGSGATLSASLLVLASFFVALMF